MSTATLTSGHHTTTVGVSVTKTKAKLPKEVLVAAAEYSLQESKAGRCVHNDDVEGLVSRQRGWM